MNLSSLFSGDIAVNYIFEPDRCGAIGQVVPGALAG